MGVYKIPKNSDLFPAKNKIKTTYKIKEGKKRTSYLCESMKREENDTVVKNLGGEKEIAAAAEVAEQKLENEEDEGKERRK